MMRIWPLCERKNTVFALSRWYTLAAQPSSLLLKSPEIFSQSASSQNLTDEMACHINVAAADNLFFFCIFDGTFGFFILEKAVWERDRVLTRGNGLKYTIACPANGRLPWNENITNIFCQSCPQGKKPNQPRERYGHVCAIFSSLLRSFSLWTHTLSL